MCRRQILAFTAIIIAMSSPMKATAEEHWAIAYCELAQWDVVPVGKANTIEAARDMAMRNCRGAIGIFGDVRPATARTCCRILHDSTTDGEENCVAAAVAGKGNPAEKRIEPVIGFGTGKKKSQAMSMAVEFCKDDGGTGCDVKFAFCR